MRQINNDEFNDWLKTGGIEWDEKVNSYLKFIDYVSEDELTGLMVQWILDKDFVVFNDFSEDGYIIISGRHQHTNTTAYAHKKLYYALRNAVEDKDPVVKKGFIYG